MTYILITPMKDEIKSIPKLKETILSQTIKPSIWVIGDANSKDGSFQMANELFKDYTWIHIIKQKTFFEKGYSHKNIAGNLNDCYNYAKEIAKNKDIKYFYIARTDATPILSENYFEILIEEMERDPKLAFVCGTEIFQLKNSKIRYNEMNGISRTGLNDQGIYRRDFFEKMGGFPTTNAPETVLQIKASNRGWSLKGTDRTFFIKSRLGGSKIGVFKGYKLKGKVLYSLGYPIPLLLSSTVYYCLKFTPKGLGLIPGYFSSAFKRENRIDDKEVLDYFDKRMMQIFFDLKKKFFKSLIGIGK